MKVLEKINIFLFTLILLNSFNSFSQDESIYIEEPNLIESNYGIFYKNTWKPFNGNTETIRENPKLTYKSKVRNGIEYYTEIYDENSVLFEIIENGIRIEIKDSKTKSKFNESESFTNTVNLNVKKILNSFHKNFETGEKIKLNGVVKYDFEKVFYLNGVKVKIESYYDEECKILKERHEIFSTQIGSLDLNEISLSYNGKYEYWTKDGELSESGVYKMGNKVE